MHLLTDISTAPLPGCEQWLEPVSAPSNYRDEAKIAAYIDEKRQEQIARAGLDPDLSRITGVGMHCHGHTRVVLCPTEDDECRALTEFIEVMGTKTLVGYNSARFDWPFMMRRAAYLGLDLSINTDRFKSPHVDVMERLTHRGVLAAKSLRFYVSRHGWSDLVKPLSGAAEANVLQTQDWDGLEASLRHDVEALRRLCVWLKVMP